MTQDQYGRGQGSGYADGEAVPDDETGDQSTQMTRFQKVASALRGDRSTQPTDPPDPADPAAEQDAAMDPRATDPNGTWAAGPDTVDGPGTVGGPGAVGGPGTQDTVDDALPAATGTDQTGAMRSPDTGSRDYWDDETGNPATVPGGTLSAADPTMTGRSTSATTAPADRGDIDPAAGYGSQADTAAGYPGQDSTEAGSMSNLGTTQAPGRAAETTTGYGAEADTASGYGTQAGTATDPQGPAGAGMAGAGMAGAGMAGATEGAPAVGTAEGFPAGRHAADAADAGLRPGEATDRIGDFGDIAFGNLLPDAEQYTTQWQQIQFRFVDDPQGSVTEAAEVISAVTAKLEAAIQERQRAIQERQRAIEERASALRGRWGEGSNADTETLRETLRMYRVFMDQLIGSTTTR